MACTCDDVCPSAAQCGCLEIIKPDGSHCCCDCSDIPITLPIKLKAEDQVAISVRNHELVDFAEYVHRVTGEELLIPVTQLRKRVTMNVARTSFADAVRQLGLVVADADDSAY
jgi:hypothetical protein